MRFSAAGIILLLHAAGCFYVPALDQHGYTACEQDSDCNVGRSCLAATCVPPPWHDDTYGQGDCWCWRMRRPPRCPVAVPWFLGR